MKLACLQMRSCEEQIRNADSFEALVREAASANAEYVQSPEMTGLMQRDRHKLSKTIRSPDETPVIQRAEALVKELQIIIHIGSTAVLRSDGYFANRSYIFVPGNSKPFTYDKIHMFDANVSRTETWRESSVYKAGKQAVMANITSNTVLGFGICYDLRFPALFHHYATAGCHILTAPAAFTVPTGEAHWEVLIRARAIENGAYMICAAQGGKHNDGRTTYGNSMIADPWGNTTILDHNEPGVLYADYSQDKVTDARTRIPVLENVWDFK